MKYNGQHVESPNKFDEAIKLCSYDFKVVFLDFGFQHKGKCLLELGQSDATLNYFQKAMKIRLTKGDQSLIESTHNAIEYIENLGD
ncbi:hypothetical protein [Psychrobacillus sp. L3]|uniref:hypothetical protein n=1 Tax=Psychrobacillus sp. L3 TaxID=3236891 RepID=UPI0036F344B9